MRATGRLRTCTLAGLLVLSPSLAFAEDAAKPYPPCDRTPTEGDVTAAKGAFQAGNGSFNEADYDRAINYWEDAYRRDCTAHPLLLNLARVYELNGQKHHAITALQTFLARNPGSADEDQIKRRVEKLEEQLKAEAAAAAAPPPVVATPVPATAPPAAAAPPPEEPSSGKRPIAPLILAGGGGVVAIVGGVLWASALSDVSKFADQCPDRNNCPPSVADGGNSARTRATISSIVTFVGVGAAAGGLIWYFVSKPEPQTASAPRALTARVSPSLGLGYGGVQLDGQF